MAPRSLFNATVLALAVIVVAAGDRPAGGASVGLNPPDYDPLIVDPLMTGGVFTRNHTERIKWAKGILGGLKEIDDKLVALSPSQRDWLRQNYFGEISRAGNKHTQKSLDAMDTVEYRTHVVKDIYLFNLLPVLEWLARPEVPNYSLHLEITYWAAVAKRLAAADDFQSAVLFLARKNPSLRVLKSGEFTTDPNI